MRHPLFASLIGILFLAGMVSRPSPVGADQKQEALAAAKSATQFLTDSVSTRGGYLWRYSSDLALREGEGVIRSETVWVQPPGTPAIGEAFVRLYRATGDPQFLNAALEAAEALRQGQMHSGGWQDRVEFEPALRKKWAYRLGKVSSKAKDQSSLDDDKTQSAIRFLVQLDQALDFKKEAVHEMTLYALRGLTDRGQFANGGFPQVWTHERANPIDADEKAEKNVAASRSTARARYPKSWPREYPGHQQYWNQYTLNDNLATDVISTLLMAEDVYLTGEYQAAAVRLADSLLLTQMPMPQPAWAQQYNTDLEPIWARKFEPPAISASESQSVIHALMVMYQRTGERRFLDAVRPAIQYLKLSLLPDGRLARFYELESNRPLYFTPDYRLTYDDSDCPTHYSFKVDSKLKKLSQRFESLRNSEWTVPKPSRSTSARRSVSDQEIRHVIFSLDDRGAWVTPVGMRYHRHSGPVIAMSVAVDNLNRLASYLSECPSDTNLGSEE